MLRLAIDIDDQRLGASVNHPGTRQQLTYYQPAPGDSLAPPLREPSEEALLRYHLSQEEDRRILDPREVVSVRIAHITEHRSAIARDDRRVLNRRAADTIL